MVIILLKIDISGTFIQHDYEDVSRCTICNLTGKRLMTNQVRSNLILCFPFFRQLHMVHYNSKYGDAKNASKYMDGTVALSVLFEVNFLIINNFFQFLPYRNSSSDMHVIIRILTIILI